MALHIFSTIVSQTLPSSYYFPAVLLVLLVAVVRAYAQGRRTNRDRDLHARTVIITGAFTPLGLTLLEFLAKRGAHVIALVPTPSLTSHHAEILSLLRDATSNEAIYAEPCPLDSPAHIKKFCERFVNTEHEKDRRVDALIMAHEYSHIGTWGTGFQNIAAVREDECMKRDEAAMATFLLTTLLLPALLVAPIERDIRVINITNPFYAAAAALTFTPVLSSMKYNPSKSSSRPKHLVQQSKWSLEGQRALRSAVFTRHLQRILDALPDPGSAPTPSKENVSSTSDAKSVPKLKPQPSNIMAVTVSPGISRTDTIAPYLFPSSTQAPSVSRQWIAALLYIFLQPVLRIFTKTPTSALQSVLHVLCVPKPITRRRMPLGEDPAHAPQSTEKSRSVNLVRQQAEEVLVPGALYADCAVVRLDLRVAPETVTSPPLGEARTSEHDVTKADQFDLGLGDEPLGRAVWEALEDGVKIWEAQEKAQTPVEDEKLLDKEGPPKI